MADNVLIAQIRKNEGDAAADAAAKLYARLDDESPYPTQDEMNAEDAQELYRLTDWLRENHEDTRLAGERAVDWAIRLLTNWQAQ